MNTSTHLSSVSIIIALAVFSVGAFFVSAPFAFADDYSSGDVIVNEFVTNTDAGVDQWYELLNTTSSDIDLTDWVLSSAINGEMNIGTQLGSNSKILPANGLIVISVAYNPADDAGDVLQVKSPTAAVIHAVSYGDQPDPAAPNHADAPGNGESAAFVSGAWSVGTQTKGWFNDAGEPEKAPLLSTIDGALTDAEIDSNIGELENPSATPATEPDALYFEKSGKGKIVFVQSLNLSSQTTVASLQSLGAAMEMLDGHIAFDSETAAAMDAMGANIYMYGLDALGYTDAPTIIVSDDDGVVIDPDDENYPELSSIDFSGGTLTFTTDHFTQFDVPKVVNTDTGVGYGTIQAAINDASAGNTIEVTAGAYNEKITIDVANLVLQGPNAGVSGDSSRVDEAVIKPSTGDIINITVAGVSVDGFELYGSEQEGAFNGIDLNGPDANILNNRIIGNAVGAGNSVHALFPIGIRFNGGGIVDTDNALIQGNYFTLLHTAVFNQYSSGVVIDTNTFEDVRSSNANNGVADVTYTGNVYINSWNGPSFGDGVSDSIGGFVIIENNTFGINNIAVNIREYDGVGGFPEDTSINSNDFSGTVGTGIDNTSGEVIDATSNWWGSANPDFDAITSGDVTVAPWFTNSGMTTDSTEDAMTSFDLASPSVGGTASTTADAFTLTVPNGTDVTALVPIIATSTGATTNPASGSAQDFTSPVTYTVTSADGSESREYVVTVNVVAENQTVPDAGGDATSNSDNPEVVITDPDQPVDITITSGTDNPTIDVSSFMTDDGEDTMGTLPEITINSDVADVVIPDNTVVTGPSGWDGIIDAPTEGTPAGGNAPAGFSVGSVVISIGSDAGTLFFDSPVTIVLPGVTGTVGYRPAGSDVWQTISACSGGTYNAPTPPLAPGECSINNGTDTKIVTFHFTSFGGMNAVSSGGGSTGGGGGGNSPAGGPQTGHSIIPGLAVAGTGAGTGIGTGVGSGTGSTGGEVLGAAAYNFARNFGFGARGADVDALQQALIDGGFLKITAPTGYFGVLTRAAGIAFQAKYGIAQIGVVGPVTRAQLNKGATPAGTSSITEPQVQALLGLLRSFGTDESIIANTEKALRNR